VDEVAGWVSDRAAGPGGALDGHGQPARRRGAGPGSRGCARRGSGQDRGDVLDADRVDDLDVGAEVGDLGCGEVAQPWPPARCIDDAIPVVGAGRPPGNAEHTLGRGNLVGYEAPRRMVKTKTEQRRRRSRWQPDSPAMDEPQPEEGGTDEFGAEGGGTDVLGRGPS
jgi:hypothetical protein